MQTHGELLFIEELPLDEPSELLRSMPEIRQRLDHAAADDELGLRAVLDRPETLSRAWRRHAISPRRRSAMAYRQTRRDRAPKASSHHVRDAA